MNSPSRIRFDPTVNLGHILTMAAMLVSCLLAYAHLDKRVSLLEQLAATYVPQYNETRKDVIEMKAREKEDR